MNNDNNRPEWAQGDEWDGWVLDCLCIGRNTRDIRIRISREFEGFRVGRGYVVLSPATALAIANLIAEDRGGWA